MLASLTIVAAVLASIVSAQTEVSGAPATSTVSQSMPPSATQGFNPAEINSSEKESWCLAQLHTCGTICNNAAGTNICDQNALTYTCICANGTAPDVTAYLNTLPFFICQATFGQCQQNNAGDADAQAQCTANEKCGSLNATAETAAAATTSSAAASSSAAPSSTIVSSATTSAASSAAPAATTSKSAASFMSTEVTTGAFAGLLFAAFKLIL